MRVITTYDRVTLKVAKWGHCPVCSGRVKRSITLGQTLNPFNRRPDGKPKDRQDIMDALIAESAEWEPDFTHAGCAT